MYFFTAYESVAQIDSVSNYHINKHIFQETADSIFIYLEVYKQGHTDQEQVDSNIICKVVLNSTTSYINSEFVQTNAEFTMRYDKKSGTRQAYSISIPVEVLNQDRYYVDVLISDSPNHNYISITEFGIFPAPINIGDMGVVKILGNIIINDNKYKYAFVDFAPYSEPVPTELAGDYLKGFCNDELINIQDFNIYLWKTNNTEAPQITMYYSLDYGEYKKNNNTELVDDSDDGELEYNDSIYRYNFYNNEDIKELSIDLNANILDLIEKLELDKTEFHNLSIYFTISNNKNELRIPANENFNIKFKIANAPHGADCQAELLPIDLLDFDVIKKDKSVHIKWTTREEINNDYFEIQKGPSTKDWDNIVKIKGKGNANTYNNYEYTDIFPLPGVSYYRLRQTDFNGSFKYSKVKVIFNIENKLILYPNPTHKYLHYTILNPEQKYQIEIFNSQGQIMKIEKLPNENTKENIIDISHFDKGIYFLKYINLSNYRVDIMTFVKN